MIDVECSGTEGDMRMRSSLTEEDRAGEVDILRAIGIISMLMGHVGFGDLFGTYISAFHMPLFFIVSGYFFNQNRGLLGSIKHNFVKLIIPYLTWGLLYELIWMARGKSQWEGIIWPNTIEIPMNGALWFLPALFWVIIIADIIFKLLPEKVALVFLLLLSVVGSFHLVALPFSLDSSLVACRLFVAGYITKKYLQFLLDLKIFMLVILFAITSVSIYINGTVNIRTNEYSCFLLFFFNSYLTTILFWNICKLIEKYAKGWFIGLIKEIGTDSLIYVCINQFILRILWTLSIGTSFYYLMVWHVAEFIIILLICFLLNRFIRHIHMEFLVGKLHW